MIPEALLLTNADAAEAAGLKLVHQWVAFDGRQCLKFPPGFSKQGAVASFMKLLSPLQHVAVELLQSFTAQWSG